MNKKHFHYLSITVWIIFVVIFGLGFYVNNYLPHGQMYDAGYENDNGVEVYKEDLRGVNTPDWAKFIKNNSSGIIVLMMGLALAGIILNEKAKRKE